MYVKKIGCLHIICTHFTVYKDLACASVTCCVFYFFKIFLSRSTYLIMTSMMVAGGLLSCKSNILVHVVFLLFKSLSNEDIHVL